MMHITAISNNIFNINGNKMFDFSGLFVRHTVCITIHNIVKNTNWFTLQCFFF